MVNCITRWWKHQKHSACNKISWSLWCKEEEVGTTRYWRRTKPFEVYFGLRQIWDATLKAEYWRGRSSENWKKDLAASSLEMNAMSCLSRVKHYFREVRSSWTDFKSSRSSIFYTRYGTDWRFSLWSWYIEMFPSRGWVEDHKEFIRGLSQKFWSR